MHCYTAIYGVILPDKRLSPSPPTLPECHDVHQDGAGAWHATHYSGRPVTGATWDDIVADACAVRIIESLRRAWS
jgi:hypothetical protein